MKTICMIVCVIILVLLPACNNEPSQEKYVTQPITEDHSNIADPVARWNAYHLSSYMIEQQCVCFCMYGGDVVKLYVKENKLIDIVLKSTGKSIFDQFKGHYKTSEELFALAASLNPDSLASLSIEYDKRFGFPKRISVDVDQHMADEEYDYETTTIERLLN